MGLKLSNKNDPADAFALAIFAFDPLDEPEYFLRFEINLWDWCNDPIAGVITQAPESGE